MKTILCLCEGILYLLINCLRTCLSIFFFFSSRRRHTRSDRDWSSDVCSSDLIEGLAQYGKLHPVQEAFVKEGAMQCGYCVPGMILATVALLKRNPTPNQTQIVEALNGNICRCCGYVNVLKAVQRAAQPVKEAQ